jgi:hypothetical protein
MSNTKEDLCYLQKVTAIGNQVISLDRLEKFWDEISEDNAAGWLAPQSYLKDWIRQEIGLKILEDGSSENG